jgi:putative DNA primase/helicase
MPLDPGDHPTIDDAPWPEDNGEDDGSSAPPECLTLDDMRGGPIPLGFDRDGRSYYLSPTRGIIACLTPQQHNEANLRSLAPVSWYASYFRDRRGISWKSVAETFFRFSDGAGLYNPEHVRGRGVHMDGDHIVMHLGNVLLVDGKERPLGRSPVAGSDAIYAAGYKLNMRRVDPIRNAEAVKFAELLDRCCWKDSFMGPLVAGWAVVSPFCGALPFRPYMWMTGVSGAGKNWVIENLISPLMGDFMVSATLSTTAAGIRRHLKTDALAFWIDEAESETERSADAITDIIRLARGSSNGNQQTIMGDGVNGTSNVFVTKSMFLFSSTVHSLSATADINRTVHVELMKGDDKEEFAALQAATRALLTPDYCHGMICRTYAMFPTILHNIRMFADALAVEITESRIADTMAPLLAGYNALKSDQPLTPDAARAIVKSREWVRRSALTAKDQSIAEHFKAVNHLMTARVELTPSQRWEVGELVGKVFKKDAGSDVEPLLMRFGIRCDTSTGDQYVWIARNHPAANRLYTNTPWADNRWTRVLSQHPGAIELGNKRFGSGTSPFRVIAFRWRDIDGASDHQSITTVANSPC